MAQGVQMSLTGERSTTAFLAAVCLGVASTAPWPAVESAFVSAGVICCALFLDSLVSDAVEAVRRG